MFTIDKVLASLVKHVNTSRALYKTYWILTGNFQVQIWEQDQKLEKIAKLLWDERRLEAPTVEDHRKFRQQAEEILGPEESLFRIDWVSTHTTLLSFSGVSYPTWATFPAPGIKDAHVPTAQQGRLEPRRRRGTLRTLASLRRRVRL